MSKRNIKQGGAFSQSFNADDPRFDKLREHNPELWEKSPAMAIAQSLGAFGGPGPLNPGQPFDRQHKRKPLLCDKILAYHPMMTSAMEPRRLAGYLPRLREAKRFVLDRDACRYAAEMIRDYPQMIARDLEFAIPPFANLYIEIGDWPVFFDTLNPGMYDAPIDGRTGVADTGVAYHVDGPRAYILTESAAKEASLMPFLYRLNKPDSEWQREFIKAAEAAKLEMDIMYWGNSYMQLSPRDRSALRAQHSLEWLYAPRFIDNISDETMGKLLVSGVGDLRNIMALILFLNRTREITYEEELPHAHTLIARKPSAMLKHSIIRLRLDPRPMLKSLSRGHAPGGMRREHDVMGHFCHDRTARAAQHHRSRLFGGPLVDEHDWREYGVNQWRCMRCGGKRWHRKEHKRGKAAGRVESSYEVTK